MYLSPTQSAKTHSCSNYIKCFISFSSLSKGYSLSVFSCPPLLRDGFSKFIFWLNNWLIMKKGVDGEGRWSVGTRDGFSRILRVTTCNSEQRSLNIYNLVFLTWRHYQWPINLEFMWNVFLSHASVQGRQEFLFPNPVMVACFSFFFFYPG